MADPSSLSIENYFCHNSDCPDHGQRGHGNVYFRGWSGRDKRMQDAATYLVSYSYNFCWPVRTLRLEGDEGWQPRTPAMAAGLAYHVWSLREWLTYPAKPCLPV